jgi:hypothetical protein
MTKQTATEHSTGRISPLKIITLTLLTCLACLVAPKLSALPPSAPSAGELKMTGTYLKFSVTPDDEKETPASQAQFCSNIFKGRFAHAPYSAIITPGEDYIEVYVNTSQPEHLKDIKEHLTYKGKLSIHLVHKESSKLADSVTAKKLNIPGYITLPHSETNSDNREITTTQILIREKAELTEKDIKSALLDPRDQTTINIELTTAGGEKMHAFTEPLDKGVDKIATVFNGRIVNYAVLNASLGRHFVISGLALEESKLFIGATQNLINSTLKITEQRSYRIYLQPH